MNVRHWIWIIVGLLFWTAITVIWVTGPRDCQAPDAHHRVVCRR